MSGRADADRELLVLVAVLGLAGMFGVFSIKAAAPEVAAWYQRIAVPWYAAPFWGYVLGWSCAYAAAAVAAWLVWREAGWPRAWPAAAIWGVQLAVLTAWNYLMLAAHRTGWALPAIALVLVLAGTAVIVFRKSSAPAAVLMALYSGWIAYAGLLNFEIWRLSP